MLSVDPPSSSTPVPFTAPTPKGQLGGNQGSDGIDNEFSGHLLDLPEDVLKAILRALRFGRSAISPHGGQADVASFARCSRAAHALASPMLYKYIQLTRLSILEPLYNTLKSRPDLAAHVQYLSVGPNFVDHNQLPLGFNLATMKRTPQSGIVDLSLVKMHGKQLTHRLIATWFACLAEQTPTLRGIDASPIGFLSVFFLPGFAGLASVLRRRRAWYKSCPTEFFTVIAVDEPARPSPLVGAPPATLPARTSPFGVYCMDFGRQVMDVTNMIDPCLLEQTFASRFSDIVPGHEQSQWKIRHVDYSDVHRITSVSSFFHPQLGPIADVLMGVKLGQDHHYTLTSGQVVGNVSVESFSPSSAAQTIKHIQPLQVDVCPHVLFSSHGGPGARPTVGKAIVQELTSLSSTTSAFQYTARLTFRETGFINSSTIDDVLMSIAASMPNLIAISLDQIKATLPEILSACDALIRRMPEQGRALEELSVFSPSPTSCVDRSESPASVPKRTPKTRSRAKVPLAPSPAPPKRKPTLSPLPQTHRGATRLRRLVMDWPQVHHRLCGVLIHPGLLHSIQVLSITLMVPFDIMAPSVAQPDSPSFTSYSFKSPPKHLKIGHAHLPNLVALKLDTQFIEPLCQHRTRAGFVASLPQAANLKCLIAMRIPMPMAAECDTVIDTVAKYPKLTTAAFVLTLINMPGLRKIVQKVLAPVTCTLDRLILANTHNDASYVLVGGRDGQFRFSDYMAPKAFTLAPEIPAQALPKGAMCSCGPDKARNVVKSAVMLNRYVCDTCGQADYMGVMIHESPDMDKTSNKWSPALRAVASPPDEEGPIMRMLPAKEWGLVMNTWESGRDFFF